MKNEREKELQIELQEALEECGRLRQENSRLKAQLSSSSLQPTPDLQISSNDQKPNHLMARLYPDQSSHLMIKYLSFIACFVVEKMYIPYAGRVKKVNQGILQHVPTNGILCSVENRVQNVKTTIISR